MHEYWLNFVERLEEGLGELKLKQNQKEQERTTSLEQYPSLASTDSLESPLQEHKKLGDMSPSINESFILHTKEVEAPPID